MRIQSLLTAKFWLLGLALVCAQAWAAKVVWAELSPAEKHALAPLQAHWVEMDDVAQAKWREVAKSYAQASPPAQDRMQTRMHELARMSAEERALARKNYQTARKHSPEETKRQQKWRAFQALDPAEKERLRHQKLQHTAAPSP